MSFNKISFEESLVTDVVKSGRCVACGTCVIVCPFNCLEYEEEGPILTKECKVYGIYSQLAFNMNRCINCVKAKGMV